MCACNLLLGAIRLNDWSPLAIGQLRSSPIAARLFEAAILEGNAFLHGSSRVKVIPGVCRALRIVTWVCGWHARKSLTETR